MGKHAAVELKVLDLGSGEDDKSPSASGPSTQRNSISGDGFSTPTTDTEAEAGSSDDETPLDIIPASQKVLSRGRAIIIITQLISVQLFSSFCNGVIVVGLPSIASSLHMQGSLLLWPTSVFYLTAGACLMLAGSIADVIGTRPMVLTSSALLAISAACCGVSRNGAELIAFRGLQGISNAIAVPASVSIISTRVQDGQPRNIGFSCLGFAAPLGFLLGLVLGGVFVDGVGWRPAFYLVSAASCATGCVGVFVLPKDEKPKTWNCVKKQLKSEIDWVGTLISSTGLVTLSYALATLSADVDNIKTAKTIALLVIGLATVPTFVVWMNHQVKNNRPALIPNSFWRDFSFTSICIMILFNTAVTNGMEVFASLFFQQVQGLSALGASIRILPSLITAVLTNISTGYFVNRMPVVWMVLIACGLSALSPVLMAIINPQWPYWYMAFFAQLLQGICFNVLFTVGLLIISAIFPPHTQALGGAVFNTCAQLGTSIGLTITSVISDSRTAASGYDDKTSPQALMTGYRAVFWALFAWMLVVLCAGVGGLRKVGKIGVKRD
ncbi:MFS general substrate transporter [Aureobasidium sp. EXF-8845]|nr:MFS general substrate transporter [Aureobasidium sp. EXF-8845]KAI4850068.1 MFS general substrate transporter [Aureobasidium sp. EXF-8846]